MSFGPWNNIGEKHKTLQTSPLFTSWLKDPADPQLWGYCEVIKVDSLPIFLLPFCVYLKTTPPQKLTSSKYGILCVCECVLGYTGVRGCRSTYLQGDIILTSKELLELALRERTLLEPIRTVASQESHWLKCARFKWMNTHWKSEPGQMLYTPCLSAMEFDLHTNRNGARENLHTLSVVKYQV